MRVIAGEGSEIATMLFGAPVAERDRLRAALASSIRSYRHIQAVARSLPTVSFAYDLGVVRAAIRREIAALRE